MRASDFTLAQDSSEQLELEKPTRSSSTIYAREGHLPHPFIIGVSLRAVTPLSILVCYCRQCGPRESQKRKNCVDLMHRKAQSLG